MKSGNRYRADCLRKKAKKLVKQVNTEETNGTENFNKTPDGNYSDEGSLESDNDNSSRAYEEDDEHIEGDDFDEDHKIPPHDIIHHSLVDNFTTENISKIECKTEVISFEFEHLGE